MNKKELLDKLSILFIVVFFVLVAAIVFSMIGISLGMHFGGLW